MSVVVIRRRLRRRSGDWRYRLNRWFQRNRPEAAVGLAFVIACLLGLIGAGVGF